ncbi:MAG: sugar phosphate isomerase/epimerase family protein [Candidatus Hodarchaeales archaeon]|jgi:sugar phosphate isomerase/epimerase
MHEIGISLLASSNTIVIDLEKAINEGFSHIELKWDNFTSHVEQEYTFTLLQSQDWENITLSLHTPLQNINIGSLSEIRRKQSISCIIKAIRIAEKLNTKFVVLHGGKIPVGIPRDQKTKEKAYLAQLKSIEEINLFCKERGVVIALENGYSIKDQGLLTTIDEMAQLNENVDGLSFILDIGHFIINNPLSDIQKQLKNHPHLHFSAIHLHDNNQNADDHLILGNGILLQRKEELKVILQSINNCPIIIENTLLNAALMTRTILLRFVL